MRYDFISIFLYTNQFFNKLLSFPIISYERIYILYRTPKSEESNKF